MSIARLQQFVATNDIEGVKQCLDHGENVNAQCQESWFENGPRMETLLHIAARYEFYDIFMLIYQRGANINLKNSFNQTPFDVAEPSFRKKLMNGLSPDLQQKSQLSDQTTQNIQTDSSLTSLPRGWICARDRRNGRPYYIHLPTRTSQWKRPLPGQTDGAINPQTVRKPCTLTQKEKDEQIRYIEEILAQRQYEIELQQQQLRQIDQQLEVQRRLELIKTGRPNWQISYDEIEFQNKLGEGCFGEVFKGKWHGTDIAVKVLKSGDCNDPNEISAFEKEVTGLRALQHPCIVLFLGACTAPNLCHVSEYMNGGSLFALLYKKKHVPNVNKRAGLCKDIALALSYLHNCRPPIIHKGIKSLNVLLDVKQEHAKVCDIGLGRGRAEDFECKAADAPSYLWMSPEMLSGAEIDTKADIYSFALVAYEMCTGKLPFAGLSLEKVKEMVNRGERPPIKNVSGDKWRTLIETCWTRNPSQRPTGIQITDRLAEIK